MFECTLSFAVQVHAMATIAELLGMYTYMKGLVVEERRTYRDISTELRRSYPMIWRGLSERSIARFCERYNIHATSCIPDQALDTVVRSSVAKVRVYRYMYLSRLLSGPVLLKSELVISELHSLTKFPIVIKSLRCGSHSFFRQSTHFLASM